MLARRIQTVHRTRFTSDLRPDYRCASVSAKPQPVDAGPSSSPFHGVLEAALFIAVAVALAAVALLFDMKVNRVFDIPKARALKTLAGGASLVWLALALFGPGVRWKSVRVFAAPVAALAVAFSISTLLSIDIPTSLHGVYERQFGLEGFLACVGIYFVVATSLKGGRGAVFALSIIALLGGIIGAYAFVQSTGHDPWPFFRKPHNKVYAYLGNATFTGNALALIFPITTLLGITGATETYRRENNLGRWGMGLGIGFLALLGLLVLPGYLAGADLGPKASGKDAQVALKIGVAAASGLYFMALGMGSGGPGWLRLDDAGQRKLADAFAAGATLALGLLLAGGLYFTRTRGAWGGSGIAIIGGLILLPSLFKDDPKLQKKVRLGSWGFLVLFSIAFSIFVAKSDALAARTIRSVYAAFFDNQTVGKGQGTRPYLWGESVRTLTEHEDTLKRIYEDEEARAEALSEGNLDGLPFSPVTARSEEEKRFDTGWRKISVWLFGIGIETYRYAFMSHKSKKLEELDPMTNHDNPHNNYLYLLASLGIVGLLAYLWLMWRLLSTSFKKFRDTSLPRSERMLAFGILSSAFSYAVYSLAGFDSVACSVFLYFLLGATAALFAPAEEEAQKAPLAPWIVGDLRHWRSGKTKPQPLPAKQSGQTFLVAAAVAVVFGGLLLEGAMTGARYHQAELAFTGRDGKQVSGPMARVKSIESAIELNGFESYYKQMLGSTYAQLANAYLRTARTTQQQAQTETDPQRAQQLAAQARSYAKEYQEMSRRAELSLMAALEHSWAPENIYISLFQTLYAAKDDAGAEAALERALRHSPHLGAVRANLAAMKLQRGAWKEALVDCRWVLEVDYKSSLAYRICGKSLLELGELKEARWMLEKAKYYGKTDRQVDQIMAELERAEAKALKKAEPAKVEPEKTELEPVKTEPAEAEAENTELEPVKAEPAEAEATETATPATEPESTAPAARTSSATSTEVPASPAAATPTTASSTGS